jgi:hypothetical protein
MKRQFLDLVIMHPEGVPRAEHFFSFVSEHPDVYMCPVDTHYFSSQAFLKGAGWYEAHFADATPGQKRVERSTSYLEAAGVAARLSREYPDARLCALIADPIECVLTAYDKAGKSKSRAADSLEAWLEANPAILQRYLFGKQLSGFIGYYSPVDFFILTLDDVRANAGKAIMQLYQHLGVATTFIPKELRVLTEEEKKPGFWARRLRLDRLRARRRAARLAVAQAAFPPAPQVSISPRERVLLSRYYQADVALLSNILNTDVRARWQYPEPTPPKRRRRQN